MRRTQFALAFALVGLGLLAFAGCRRHLPPDVTADIKTVSGIRDLLNTTAGDSETSAVPTANPTGFANFVGTIKVNGPPPPMPPAPVTGGDAGYCATPGGKPPLMQTVVVGPGGGFKNVLVYVDMPLPVEWEHPDYAATRDAVLDGPRGFDQKNCMFLSHVFSMRATQSVAVMNSDSVSHNTNIKGKGNANATNETIPVGKQIIYVPKGASRGPFQVMCNIHNWMEAYMCVHENPYFAVTDDEGRFEIKNLPAGVDLDFRVWQEKVKGNWKGVTVNGSDPKWSKGKFTLNLQPESTEEWEIVVDASILQ